MNQRHVMLTAGLTSVTFRKLCCEEIISLTKRAGLEVIEWGGDVHVPHGAIKRAREVRAMMADNGLRTSSYGSYYCCGMDQKTIEFEKILETAAELNAPLIRVWAGNKGSNESTEKEREVVVLDSRRIAKLACHAGIKIGFEFHNGSLSDNAEAMRSLIMEIGQPGLGAYWQTPMGMPFEECCASLEVVLPYLLNLHVFYWAGEQRMLLAEGNELWRILFEIVKKSPENHSALLEFVLNDDISFFMKDAKTLVDLLK